jgi:DNA invertase Pin-like site-specific DNA recombinase
MTGLKIGYARVSTDEQDLTAQRDALAALGVAPERTYLDHGLTGTNRDRPGLREAMAALPRRRRPRSDQARPARPIPARRP